MQNPAFRVQTPSTGRSVRRLHSAFCILRWRVPFLAVVGVLALFSASPASAQATLVEAAEQGDRAAVLRLLAQGADPNTAGPDGTTAVMWAAANDDAELVRALVKAGAKVTAKNHFGTTALTEAA